MKRIYSEQNSLFIHQIKDLLEEKGIKSIIKNEFLSGGAGELPPIEVWPELWIVEKEDKVPARKIVDDFLSSVNTQSESRNCPICDEIIEGQFLICWNCGAKFD